MPTTALDFTGGITEYSSRIALKMLLSQFGEVTACWIPPLDARKQERAYVKFGTTAAAKAALDAAHAGQLFLDGVPLKAEWRMAPSRTQDSRDFEARGSNLMTSRDLMRAERKQQLDRDSIKQQMLKKLEDRNREKDKKKEKERERSKARDRSRDRSRDRDRRRSRDKSRDRKKKDRDRSKSKKKSRSKTRSKSRKTRSKSTKSSRSRSRSRSKKRRKDSSSKVEAIEDDPEFMENGCTSAVL